MSFVSLEKYLNGARKRQAEPELAQVEDFSALTQEILESIEYYAVPGEVHEDLCNELRTIRLQLTRTKQADSLSSISNKIREILRQSQERSKRAEIERNREFGTVLNMLSEALTHVSSRNERSRNKYRVLEESLQSASKLDSVAAIRSNLSRVLEFVRSEEEHERETGSKAENAIGAHLQQAQQCASRLRVRMLERRHALHDIQLAFKNGHSLDSALFVCNQLQSIRTRHGNDTCDQLMDELGRRELLELVANGAVYSWSPNSLLLLWRAEKGSESREELLRKLKPAYEQRTLVGNRMATFRIAFKSLVTHLNGEMKDIVDSLDLFEKGVR